LPAKYNYCLNTDAADLDMCKQNIQWGYKSGGTCEDHGFPVECKMVLNGGEISNYKTAADCKEAHDSEESARKMYTEEGKPYLCKYQKNRADYVKNAAACKAMLKEFPLS